MKKLAFDGTKMVELESVEVRKAKKGEQKTKVVKPANKAGKAENK